MTDEKRKEIRHIPTILLDVNSLYQREALDEFINNVQIATAKTGTV